MAVTRSLLKSMGLTDEQVSTVIDAHTETVEGLKADRDRYKADAEKLADVQKELESLKGGEDWKTKYDNLDKAFKDYKAEIVGKEKAEKVNAAYRKLLESANVDKNRIDAIMKVTDTKDYKLKDDGTLEGAEEITKGIKNEWAAFITKTGTRGADVSTPPDSNSGNTLTRADIYAKDERGHYKLSTAERQKALVNNPELMHI